MFRRILLLVAVLALALPFGAPARSTATTLKGTVGPGFSISLKTVKGVKVRTLPAGDYLFRVADRSSSHNFQISGPGYRAGKALTTVGAVGIFTTPKAKPIKLKKGTYTFYCLPHRLDMRGTFKVT